MLLAVALREAATGHDRRGGLEKPNTELRHDAGIPPRAHSKEPVSHLAPDTHVSTHVHSGTAHEAQQ